MQQQLPGSTQGRDDLYEPDSPRWVPKRTRQRTTGTPIVARSYGALKVSMWEPGSDFRQLSPMAQWAYTMLLSQPQITNLGLLAFTPEKWVRLANGLTAPHMEAAIGELEEHRYLLIDRETGDLLVRTFIKHDRVFAQPALTTNARSLIRSVESDTIRNYLIERHPWLIETDWNKTKIETYEDGYVEPEKTPPERGLEENERGVFEKSKEAQVLDAGSGAGPGSSSRREKDQLLEGSAAAEKDSGDDREAPRLGEIQQAVDDLNDHDDLTIRQVEPLALAIPRTVFCDVVERHKRRLADGDVRNETGLFVHLLRGTVKNYARAVEMAQLDIQKTPLDDVLADCRYYAARLIPWDAAEPLIAMKFKRWELPDVECQEIIDEAKRTYLTAAA